MSTDETRIVPAEGDSLYRQRLDAVKSPDLQSLISNASTKISESPLDRSRNDDVAFPVTKKGDAAFLPSRVVSFQSGLNPVSMLKAGASNVWHKCPRTGRVRASMPYDAPETLFQVGN